MTGAADGAHNRRRSRIDANDLAGYGSVANGTVNVDSAARGLGASKTEVRQAIRQAEAAQSNTFYRRISGQAEADSTEGTSMRGMLQAVFGRGPRGGAVDARAAAQSLGVSPGTVRRWAAGTQTALAGTAGGDTAGGAPHHHHQKRPAGRDRRLPRSTQGSQALSGGSKIWVSGEQGWVDTSRAMRAIAASPPTSAPPRSRRCCGPTRTAETAACATG